MRTGESQYDAQTKMRLKDMTNPGTLLYVLVGDMIHLGRTGWRGPVPTAKEPPGGSACRLARGLGEGWPGR